MDTQGGKTSDFFQLRTLTATMKLRLVPPLLPLSFAAFWKKKVFQMLHEIPHFGQGRKIFPEKVSKKQKPSNTISTSKN